MNESPFDIIVTTRYGINIRLFNQNPKWEKGYSNFTDIEGAHFFANTLERVLENADFSDRHKCAHCGKHLSKSDQLYRLENGQYMHTNCFYKAKDMGEIEDTEKKEFVDRLAGRGDEKLDFTNLRDGKAQGLMFSIEAVSKKSILITVRENARSCKHNLCFTHVQCMWLIEEIRLKIKGIEDSELYPCHHCGGTIHADETHFLFASGENVHGCCMASFMRSATSADTRLPIARISCRDIFGHIRLHGERSFL